MRAAQVSWTEVGLDLGPLPRPHKGMYTVCRGGTPKPLNAPNTAVEGAGFIQSPKERKPGAISAKIEDLDTPCNGSRKRLVRDVGRGWLCHAHVFFARRRFVLKVVAGYGAC